DVERVDEAPGDHAHRLDPGDLREVPVDAERAGAVAPRDVVAAAPAPELVPGADHLHLRHLRPDRLDVAEVEVQLPPGEEPAVRLARPLRPDEEGVGRSIGEAALDAVAEAVPRPEHDHQHEDAPEHPERRQEGAHLVARQGLEDLLPVITVEDAHSLRSASTGRSLPARRAGKYPAAAPATMSRMVACTATPRSTSGLMKKPSLGRIPAATCSTTIPRTSPTYPATEVMRIDSFRMS